MTKGRGESVPLHPLWIYPDSVLLIRWEKPLNRHVICNIYYEEQPLNKAALCVLGSTAPDHFDSGQPIIDRLPFPTLYMYYKYNGDVLLRNCRALGSHALIPHDSKQLRIVTEREEAETGTKQVREKNNNKKKEERNVKGKIKEGSHNGGRNLRNRQMSSEKGEK